MKQESQFIKIFSKKKFLKLNEFFEIPLLKKLKKMSKCFKIINYLTSIS
jgi:hypothetical protein